MIVGILSKVSNVVIGKVITESHTNKAVSVMTVEGSLGNKHNSTTRSNVMTTIDKGPSLLNLEGCTSSGETARIKP